MRVSGSQKSKLGVFLNHSLPCSHRKLIDPISRASQQAPRILLPLPLQLQDYRFMLPASRLHVDRESNSAPCLQGKHSTSCHLLSSPQCRPPCKAHKALDPFRSTRRTRLTLSFSVCGYQFYLSVPALWRALGLIVLAEPVKEVQAVFLYFMEGTMVPALENLNSRNLNCTQT